MGIGTQGGIHIIGNHKQIDIAQNTGGKGNGYSSQIRLPRIEVRQILEGSYKNVIILIQVVVGRYIHPIVPGRGTCGVATHVAHPVGNLNLGAR